MAYVNVKDWSVDQVTEWIKGTFVKIFAQLPVHNLTFLMF